MSIVNSLAIVSKGVPPRVTAFGKASKYTSFSFSSVCHCQINHEGKPILDTVVDIRRKLHICYIRHCYCSLKSCCELMVYTSGSLIFIQSSPKFRATQSIFVIVALLFHLIQSPATFMSTLLLLIFPLAVPEHLCPYSCVIPNPQPFYCNEP
ncbi:hypothetical protein GH733_017235 [Mirounga leonina]|nr:hypothetical protein GH733_017235 [Mirounga leonina]